MANIPSIYRVLHISTGAGFLPTVSTLPETNSESPWKWMVGRQSFPFGFGHIFQGQAVSFREGTFFSNIATFQKPWRKTPEKIITFQKKTSSFHNVQMTIPWCTLFISSHPNLLKCHQPLQEIASLMFSVYQPNKALFISWVRWVGPLQFARNLVLRATNVPTSLGSFPKEGNTFHGFFEIN